MKRATSPRQGARIYPGFSDDRCKRRIWKVCPPCLSAAHLTTMKQLVYDIAEQTDDDDDDDDDNNNNNSK